jgi:hypothetical protein
MQLALYNWHSGVWKLLLTPQLLFI